MSGLLQFQPVSTFKCTTPKSAISAAGLPPKLQTQTPNSLQGASSSHVQKSTGYSYLETIFFGNRFFKCFHHFHLNVPECFESFGQLPPLRTSESNSYQFSLSPFHNLPSLLNSPFLIPELSQSLSQPTWFNLDTSTYGVTSWRRLCPLLIVSPYLVSQCFSFLICRADPCRAPTTGDKDLLSIDCTWQELQ